MQCLAGVCKRKAAHFSGQYHQSFFSSPSFFLLVVYPTADGSAHNGPHGYIAAPVFLLLHAAHTYSSSATKAEQAYPPFFFAVQKDHIGRAKSKGGMPAKESVIFATAKRAIPGKSPLAGFGPCPLKKVFKKQCNAAGKNLRLQIVGTKMKEGLAFGQTAYQQGRATDAQLKCGMAQYIAGIAKFDGARRIPLFKWHIYGLIKGYHRAYNYQVSAGGNPLIAGKMQRPLHQGQAIVPIRFEVAGRVGKGALAQERQGPGGCQQQWQGFVQQVFFDRKLAHVATNIQGDMAGAKNKIKNGAPLSCSRYLASANTFFTL